MNVVKYIFSVIKIYAGLNFLNMEDIGNRVNPGWP
jgi:hypothetical protein